MDEAAVDAAFWRITAANALDHPLGRYLLARVLHFHDGGGEVNRRSLRWTQLIKAKRESSSFVDKAPSHLAHGVHHAADARADGIVRVGVALDGFRQFALDYI